MAGFDHMISSGLRPRSYLWVVDRRQVTFSCTAKRKSPKRRPPEWRSFPALRGFGFRRCPDAASLLRGSGKDILTLPLLGRSPKALRCSGAPYGIFKTPLGKPSAACSRSTGPKGRARDRDRAQSRQDGASAHPLRQMRREGTGEAGADHGACFLFVPFLCTSKEKGPRARGRSHPLLVFTRARSALDICEKS